MRYFLSILILCAGLSLHADDRGIKIQSAIKAGLSDYDPSRMHALLIGINEYEEWSDLRSARPDVEAIAKILKEDYGYPDNNIQVITDKKATRRAIYGALDSYRKLDDADSLIIYYAGHGWMDEDRNGFWVPTDGPRNGSYDYVSNARIVNEYFKKYKVKHLLVVADSCFAGAIMRSGEYQRENNWELPRSFNKPSRWVMTSGDLAPVEDDAGSGHSPFATRVMQFLQHSDSPAFGVNDLYVYVRKNLESEAIANPISTPQHMPGGEYVFARLDRGTTWTPEVPTLPPVTGVPATGDIELTTRLAGALAIDGRYRQNIYSNRTYTLTGIAAGTHQLSIQGNDGTWTETVNVPANGKVAVTAQRAAAPPSFNAPVTTSINLELMPIKAGRYLMGGSGGEPDELPGHLVTLSRPYWIGKTEVTTDQFLSYLKATGNESGVDLSNAACPIAKSGSSYRMRRDGQALYPMTCISYDTARAFAQWLTKTERAKGRVPSGYVYRLPTEAEWEYACHAGTSTSYSFPSSQPLSRYIWYSRSSRGTARPVANLKPNPWELYDMHGNVWEWCLDWYGTYPSTPVLDPTGHVNGTFRVVRGGSFEEDEIHQRSANRGRAKPHVTYPKIGFRVVLAPE